MAYHWQKHIGVLSAFVSYCWKDRKEDVRELAKHLKVKKKMNIWIDEDEMHGSTVDQMAEGIDNSDVVIVFFSESYQASENCQREAKYADKRKKPILYVRMQDIEKGWLVMQMGDSLWIDFKKGKPIENVADQILKQLYFLFDDSIRGKFQLINPDPAVNEEKKFASLDYTPKLQAINRICPNDTKNDGTLVLTGPSGVGKTYFMSMLFLQPENQRYLQETCKIGTVLWLNCYSHQEEHSFSDEEKLVLRKELVELLAKATKRGTALSSEDHIKILKENFQAAPLFVFDDVFHFSLLSFIRQECKSLPIVVITGTQYLNDMENRTRQAICDVAECSASTPRSLLMGGNKTVPESAKPQTPCHSKSPWEEVVDLVEHVEPLPYDKVANMLRETFGMKDLSSDDLRQIADSCDGLPGKVAEKANQCTERKNGPSPQKNSILNVKMVSSVLKRFEQRTTATTKNEPDSPKQQLPPMNFVGVPPFDNYFARPEEEDVLRKGFRCLGNKKDEAEGFFVVEGCGGIGKSTLVAHFLRDPQHLAFFQAQCNIQVVMWLNCYRWQGSTFKADELIKALFDLAAEADPNLLKGGVNTLTTLKQMLICFTDRNKRILFVLDDVFDYGILQTLRTKWGNQALCCVVTRDALKLAKNNFNPFLKMEFQGDPFSNPSKVGYLSETRALEILKADFQLKGKLKDDQLTTLSRNCAGMPLIVSLIGGQFRNCSNYERAYKKVLKTIEEGKLGSLEVTGTGRGEETASQLFQNAMNSLQEKSRYYTFLLFNPVEEVKEGLFKLLWGCDDVEDVRDVCREWEKLSIVRRVTRENWTGRKEYFDFFLIHQILHETAVTMALQDYGLSDKSDKLQLARLRIRLLCDMGLEKGEGDTTNMLQCLRRLEQNDLRTILRRIDNEAFKFLEESDCLTEEVSEYKKLLYIAAQVGLTYLVTYLLDSGIDANDPLTSGHTALMGAATGGHCNLAELLITKYNANVEIVDDYYRTALQWAACYGHEKMIELLASKYNANVNSSTNWGETVLMCAVSYGEKEKVVDLLISKYNANANAADRGGMTALMMAATRNNDKIVDLLITKGKANVDAIDRNYNMTALRMAAESGREKIVDLLITKGKATVDLADKDGKTPLMAAAWNGYYKVVDLLISKGKANVEAVNNDGETPLLYAAGHQRRNVVNLLISKYNAKVDGRTKKGETILMRAAQGGLVEMVDQLLSTGNVNVDECDADGCTALLQAASDGHENVVDLLVTKYHANANLADDSKRTVLIEAVTHHSQHQVELLLTKANVDVEAGDYCGYTALMKAAMVGDDKIIDLLMEKGKANIEAVNHSGETTLILAAWYGKESIVDLLISKYHANVEAADKDGATPVMRAGASGKQAVVDLLLQKYNANLFATTKTGQTVLYYAVLGEMYHVVEQLLASGQGNVDAANSFGQTALMNAVRNGNAKMVQMLVVNGKANVDIADNRGETALMTAAEEGFEDVVKILVEDGHANADAVDCSGKTALMKALCRGYESIANLIIRKGNANIEIADKYDGNTAFIMAASAGMVDMVDYLLSEYSIDVETTNLDGETALMKTVSHGYTKTAELLLTKCNANLRAADKKGETALWKAAREGKDRAIDLLVSKYGARLDDVDNEGVTLLMEAASFRQEKVVSLLLTKFSADLTVKDNSGRTAAMHAAANGCERIVDLFLSTGKVDVDACDDNGQTTFWKACKYGCIQVAELLYSKYHANVNTTTKDGKTPLMIAMERQDEGNNNAEVIKFLQSIIGNST